MRPKRNKPKQAIDPDDILQPAQDWLTITNIVPGNVELPDFHTASNATETAAESAQFERFLDERFPREKFAKFRHAVDEPGLSKLMNYRVLVEKRRMWRAAARIGSLFSRIVGERRPALRICEGCGLLFIARRNNAESCSPKCGSRVRMARARAKGKAKDYEMNRKLKGAAR
jgi:hypothetical protein